MRDLNGVGPIVIKQHNCASKRSDLKLKVHRPASVLGEGPAYPAESMPTRPHIIVSACCGNYSQVEGVYCHAAKTGGVPSSFAMQ